MFHDLADEQHVFQGEVLPSVRFAPDPLARGLGLFLQGLGRWGIREVSLRHFRQPLQAHALVFALVDARKVADVSEGRLLLDAPFRSRVSSDPA